MEGRWPTAKGGTFSSATSASTVPGRRGRSGSRCSWRLPTSSAACATAGLARAPSWSTRPSPVKCTTGSMTAFGCGGNAPGTGSRAARPRRAAVGYRRRHPAPAQEGALMAENLDAEWYRQALRLVLSELEDLDTAHPVDIGYRIGELKVHLRTLIGESGRPPMSASEGSRTWPGSGRSGSGRPPHNGLYATKRGSALAVLRFGESATCRRSAGVVMPGAPAWRPRRCETACGVFAVVLTARR